MKVRIISLLNVVMLATEFVSVSHAQTINVDVLDANCSDATGQPFCLARRAVEAAASGDTIMLAAGVHYGPVIINKHLTVTGAGADTTTITGGLSKRAIKIESSPIDSTSPFLTTVFISNVTIKDGGNVIEGAGIYNAGDLTISDCVITNNSADNKGGGIYSVGGVSTRTEVNNCTFNSNSTNAYSSSTGINVDGGGAIFSIGELIVNNSIFDNNSVYAHGGAVFVDSTNFYSLATIQNSTFYRNRAFSGGAIYNHGHVNLKNSTFELNSSTDVGGAVANALNGGFKASNSTFSLNSTSKRGGAIYHNGTSDAYIYSSTLVKNSAGGTYGIGGGIFFNSGSAVYLKNSLLAENTATVEATDCGGEIISQGYNLISNTLNCMITATTGDQFGSEIVLDAMLAPLADNLGITKTHALYVGSPAIDAADPSGCTDVEGNPLIEDQRGEARPGVSGGLCDIGAYEGSIEVSVTNDPVTNDPATNDTVGSDEGESSGALTLPFVMVLIVMFVARRKSSKRVRAL